MTYIERALGRGERGPDLQLWAHDRGMSSTLDTEHLEGVALNTSGDIQSNICVGKLDGEGDGVVCSTTASESVGATEGFSTRGLRSTCRRRWRRFKSSSSPTAPGRARSPMTGRRRRSFRRSTRPGSAWAPAAPRPVSRGSWASHHAGRSDHPDETSTRSMIAGLMQGAAGRGARGLPRRLRPRLPLRHPQPRTHDDAFLGPGARSWTRPWTSSALRRASFAPRGSDDALSRSPSMPTYPNRTGSTAPPSEPPKEKKWGPFKVVQAEQRRARRRRGWTRTRGEPPTRTSRATTPPSRQTRPPAPPGPCGPGGRWAAKAPSPSIRRQPHHRAVRGLMAGERLGHQPPDAHHRRAGAISASPFGTGSWRPGCTATRRTSRRN